ncbi:MAG: hypothetical protein NVSMB27_23150 [Ktedonobacteraceae bacterium]
MVLDKEQLLLMTDSTIKNHTAFLWAVADLLRGDCKQLAYGKVLSLPSRRLAGILDFALTAIEFLVGIAPRTGEG